MITIQQAFMDIPVGLAKTLKEEFVNFKSTLALQEMTITNAKWQRQFLIITTLNIYKKLLDFLEKQEQKAMRNLFVNLGYF